MNLGVLLLLLQEAPRILSPDGGWCWFEDPRAVVHAGKLVVGVVEDGRGDPERRGDIVALVHDLESGETRRIELHDRLEADDHDSPVFLPRSDGRLIAVWAKHGPENRFYVRLSDPDDPTRWGPTRTAVPSPSSRITYSNLIRVPGERHRIYNFFRGLDGHGKPSYAYSDDGAETWIPGTEFIRSAAVRPYVRYASDAHGTIHAVYTDGHPRDVDNNLYHVRIRSGRLERSDGSELRPLDPGLRSPDEGSRIFEGRPDAVAWPCDVELDEAGRPVVAYSVQMNSAGKPSGRGGDDIRYRYARWDGGRWIDRPMAFAGHRLYAGEDDYSGLVALDPADSRTVYLSTNADPSTGAPLRSAADGRRHWEIFRGVLSEDGTCWTWTPITRDSSSDNIRPLVPDCPPGLHVLLWLQGTYHSYTRYELSVAALVRRQGRGPTDHR